MCMLKIMLSLALILPGTVFAGMVVSPTRMIYDTESSARTVTVQNNSTSAFLVSASFDGEGQSYFTITPPLVRVEPGDKTLLRIRATDTSHLPADKESVFYYTVTIIASGHKPDPQMSRLAVASRYWFKLFYRPKNIGQPDSARCDLTFSREADGLYVVNKTAFYTTLALITVDGQRVSLKPDTAMIAPYSTQLIRREGNASHVEWARINDFGGSENQCRFSFVDKK